MSGPKVLGIIGCQVLEDEMAALTQNSIKYSACIKLMASKITVLRTIATQGRK